MAKFLVLWIFLLKLVFIVLIERSGLNLVCIVSAFYSSANIEFDVVVFECENNIRGLKTSSIKRESKPMAT